MSSSPLHAIRAWNSTEAGETPLCGATGYNRTIYHVYVDCPTCRLHPAFVGDPTAPWPLPATERESVDGLRRMEQEGFGLPAPS